MPNYTTASKRHSEYYCEVLLKANQLYKSGGPDALAGLHLFDIEWSQIAGGQQWASENMDELSSRYPNVGAYILDLRYWPRKGLSGEKAH